MDSPEPIIPELLTLRDFRRLFRISHTQIYREISAGRLRVRKLGTHTRIARADAEAWAAALPVRREAAA